MFKKCEKCNLDIWEHENYYYSQKVIYEGLNSEERWVVPHKKDCDEEILRQINKIYLQELYNSWNEKKRKIKEEKNKLKERKRKIREGLKKTYKYTWWFRG